MSLASQVSALATRVGQEIKAVRAIAEAVPDIEVAPEGTVNPANLPNGTLLFEYLP